MKPALLSEATLLLSALGAEGLPVATRSLCEKRLRSVLRALGPCRVAWRAGKPTVLALLGGAGDSMYGARRAAGYQRRLA